MLHQTKLIKEARTPSNSLTWQINEFGDTRVSVAVSVKKARSKLANEKVFESFEETKHPILEKFNSPEMHLKPLIPNFDSISNRK